MKIYLVLLVLLLAACTAAPVQEAAPVPPIVVPLPEKITPLCATPYIEYMKGSCCLDANQNSICDNDEVKPEVKAPAPAPKPSPRPVSTALDAVVTILNGDLQGSGFVVSEDGIIVTNAHVVEDVIYKDRSEIEIITHDKLKYNAHLIGYNAEYDIAVLRLVDTPKHHLLTSTFTALRIADPSRIKVGDQVYALGSPLGLEDSISKGIVSARYRAPPDNDTLKIYMQTDAAVNAGNSGGPLINEELEVVGVNTWGFEETQGLNFALEAKYLHSLVDGFSTYRCDYWDCYTDGLAFKDLEYRGISIGEPAEITYRHMSSQHETKFSSYTLRIKNLQQQNVTVCISTKVFNEGINVLEKTEDPLLLVPGAVITKKVDLKLESPLQYNFYYETVVDDCNGKELYTFYGMQDFTESTPTVLLPSQWQR